MSKQVMDSRMVEVRMYPSWLQAVDECARKLHYSRERFILTACQEFIEKVDERELERIYCERLREQPEDLKFAETGAKLAGMVLPKEDW